MILQILRILEVSRFFSLPMSIFSWLIIFTYSVISSGNIFYGILALIGICFVHMATNVLDDYFDYKFLIKKVDFNKNEYLKNSQKTKCRYLICNIITEKQLLYTAAVYLSIAFLTGLILYIKCGLGVLWYSIAGALIALIYPFASRICMSEIFVGLAYGPVLFGGVYYVMCGAYSKEVFLLSIPSMLMTIVLLYVHTVMDFQFDNHEGKKTIANCFDSELASLIILKILLIMAYVSLIVLCIFDLVNWQIFFAYLSIPLAVDLYKSLEIYSCNPNEMPPSKWFHHPMENRKRLEKKNAMPFMIRMYQSRNLMMYFSILMILGIIFSIGV